MVFLGGWAFLMSEVPLYARPHSAHSVQDEPASGGSVGVPGRHGPSHLCHDAIDPVFHPKRHCPI